MSKDEAFERPQHVTCEVEECQKPHNECGHDFFDPCGCHACTWDAAMTVAQAETVERCSEAVQKAHSQYDDIGDQFIHDDTLHACRSVISAITPDPAWLEREKTKARLEEAKWWSNPNTIKGIHIPLKREQALAGIECPCSRCQRIASLEAQLKEEPRHE